MQKILVIEDNPFARQVTRDTLESAGFVVLEAPDGRTALELMAQETPRVILLDMMLPDTTGLRLISQLRELPGGSSVPVVAFSGYLSRLEEARGSLLGFTEFLPKPFEPEQLLRIVHAYMPAADTKVLKPGQGRRLVLADDDADQRRLTARHLELSGFLVSGVPDGATALAKLRASPVDAVVSDILMPNTDGFQLCLQIRQDPQLRDLPVVLVTNNYLDPEDQLLAEKVGANAYMTRAAGLHAVVQAVLTGLREKGASRTVERATELDAQYTHRVIRQLERQAALNQSMVRRCSLQATALSVLGGITDALAATHDLPAALGALLTQCAEAVGVAMMAVYLSEPGGRLAMLAASDRTDVPARGVASAFGHLDLIRHIMETRSLTAIPSSAIPVGRGDEFLAMSGGQSAIVAPFVPSEGSPGALLLVAENPELTTGDWLSFARTLSAQLGLGIALARAFKGLAESDQRNRSLLESAGDGILVLDDQGNTLNVNRRAEELLGQPRATLVGKACRELLVPVAPQPGERTPVELLGAGAGVAPNLRLRRPDGSSVVIDLTVTPVSAGRKQLALVGLHDVTERNLLEQELRQAQKMEAMGRLAGGVAHDFNNLLSAILGFSDLAQSRIGETGVVLEYLREIHEAGNRAAALTDQLLAFSRKKVLAPKVLDPNAVVNDIVTMLQRLIGEDIRLVTQLEPAVAPILADPGQLQQVLMNLAVNSRDAMPHGGELRLNTANAVLKEAAGGFPDQVPPGTYVLLEVADTGTGMNPETVAHIFEPFFTTKEPGKGTGLGLATVFGIVQQSRGHIRVVTEVGRGTTFGVYLPPATTGERPERSGAERPALPRGAETILVAEDDATVRKLMQVVLEGAGYTVLAARNGEEALGLCRDRAGAIDLLVTDMVMPGGGGRELAEKVALQVPGLIVLFTSGYSDDRGLLEGVAGERLPFLSKPFTPDSLRRKVLEVLGKSAPPGAAAAAGPRG